MRHNKKSSMMTAMSFAVALFAAALSNQAARAADKKLEPLGPVPIPADNPMTPEKIELGRMLYFDPRLAGDSSLSCAKCHDPAKGFSNGLQMSDAYPGTKHWRHVPTVLNAAYLKHQFWDGRAAASKPRPSDPSPRRSR